jgi:DNA-binding MarR family transcriptional regulator
MHLRHHDQCGISEISERMETTNAAASQLVDKLVQTGLLVRVEDPRDRRAKQVSLSPEGEKLIEKGIEERYRWMDEISQALSKEQKAIIAKALEMLNRVASELEIEN